MWYSICWFYILFPKQVDKVFFLIKGGKFIQDSTSYSFTNKILKDKFTFYIDTNLYNKITENKELVINNEIAEKYLTKLYFKSIKFYNDTAFIKITYKTSWRFEGGEFLSDSELVEENNRIVKHGPVEKSTNITDE